MPPKQSKIQKGGKLRRDLSSSEDSLSPKSRDMDRFVFSKPPLEPFFSPDNRLPWNSWIRRFERYRLTSRLVHARDDVQAIARKGAPLPNCWGFIDGTARHICRPSIGQEEHHLGHKRYHCLEFQSTATPDGLIINLLGAFSERTHDAGIFRDSQFTEQLRHLCQDSLHNYLLYGDSAYPISDLLIKPYPSTTTDENAIQFNREMSKVREAVEWGFGNVEKLFAFVDIHKNMKVLKRDVASIYKVATLLTNCHTCLYMSQTSKYFSLNPPPLEKYLNH